GPSTAAPRGGICASSGSPATRSSCATPTRRTHSHSRRSTRSASSKNPRDTSRPSRVATAGCWAAWTTRSTASPSTRCPSGATSCGRSSRPTLLRRALERLTTRSPQRRILLVDADEFYVDATGTDQLYSGEPRAQTARRMREAVAHETALGVSIGGGTSKLVAKLAAGVAKPRAGTPADGVHVVAPGAELEFMRRFALADIPFIGPKFQERLAKLGLHAVNDVLRYESETLVRWLGRREGEWLAERVRGIDASPVEPHREPKSISRDETFPTDLVEDDALAARLLALADRAAADLREAGLLARTVTVKLRDADFTTRQASRTLTDPVQSERAVYDVARELLRKLRAVRRVPARLLGVAVSQLVAPDARAQLSLLDEVRPLETERDRTISRVIDQVREKFGPDALGRARG